MATLRVQMRLVRTTTRVTTMSTLSRAARTALFSSSIAIGLAACGGGSSAPSPSTPPPSAPSPTPAPPSPPSADEAARFLAQSTFGPSEGDIARVQEIGYSGWIDEQLAIAPTPHLTYVRANYSLLLFGGNFGFMQDSFWQQAITEPDQLRQRVKFALSELVVVSAESGTIATAADGLANYVDLLGQHAFGNYRALPVSRPTDDGHLPFAPAQPEGRSVSAAGRELRAK
jgi:hypothetical protein